MNIYEVKKYWKEYTGEGETSFDRTYKGADRGFFRYLCNKVSERKDNDIRKQTIEEVKHIIRSSKNMLQVIDKVSNMKEQVEDMEY